MHNPINYGSNADEISGIIQASELAALNHLPLKQNDELLNQLKIGARLGATMLFQIAQEHNLSSTQLFDKPQIEITNNKKLKR